MAPVQVSRTYHSQLTAPRSAARGNTSLESSLTLTKSLRLAIQNLGQRLARAATQEELVRKGALRGAAARPASDDRWLDMRAELPAITADIRHLLRRIEDA
ncbi:hypothetical protein KEM52_004022, partial [Ascosphaera acerosa]